MKATRSLFSYLLLPVLAVTIAAVLLATTVALTAMDRFHIESTAAGLEVQARLVAQHLDDPFDPANADRTEAACEEVAQLTQTRITIIGPSGDVLADSDRDPQEMENHAGRPEVVEALAGRVGSAQRYSRTLHSDWLYVAVPVADLGVIRVSAPLVDVYGALWRTSLRTGIGGAIIAIVAVLTVLLLTRRVARPLKEMEMGAERFARGSFDQSLPIPQPRELANLAEAMNGMAAGIRARIQAMEKQRNELQAVLSSMAEGVIAVDTDQRVVRINGAAAALLGTTPEAAQGKLASEVVRNLSFQQCVDRILSEQQPFEQELVILGVEEIILRVSAALLFGDQANLIGATFVVNDITKMRALERARSDFVANVSHELRTPVTSIKGYAETLLNDRPGDPETLAGFLETIARQSDRLCSLVDDILSLADVERAQVTGNLSFETVPAGPLVERAVSICTPKAAEKGLRVSVACDDNVSIRVNEPLFEQAVVNLIDNAIKYSEPGSPVSVEVGSRNDAACITVKDWGIGIAAEHVPLIFERFYRVDRARSRKLGGTGLGLAIVKHIVALHNGHVFVDSTLGKGSCFTIKLPAPAV